jgi:hypothetical protein
LLAKLKYFHDNTQTKLTSTSSRNLVGASNEAPIDVDLDAATAPITLREDDEDDLGAALAAIPAAPTVMDDGIAASRRPKRARRDTGETRRGDDDSDEGLFISSDDEADGDAESQSDTTSQPPPHKRRKETSAGGEGGSGDDKKKLAMDISYEGFSIYGRVLCLVVKRRDVAPTVGGNGRVASGAGGSNKGSEGQGQAMMENFIISTQIPAGDEAPS